MVVVTGALSGFDVQFDFRRISLTDLFNNADTVAIVDRTGETRSSVALRDVIEMRYNLPEGGSSQLWFNVTGLQQDANGNVIGGTVTSVLDLTGSAGGGLTTNYTMTGLAISAAAMRTAALSGGNIADDRALFETAFAGADRIRLAGGHDLFTAGGGNDLMRGNAGNDTLIGGLGQDTVEGGSGHDSLTGDGGNDRLSGQGGQDILAGGTGNDLLNGGEGADRLLGAAGADGLTGGRGNDTLSGGGGADRFIFSRSEGHDRITDFTAGLDRIKIITGAESFADVTLTQQGADTVLRFSDVTITLAGVTARSLDAGDFIFA